MAAPIIGGLIKFIEQQLGLTVWDGEIPRWDTQLEPIDLTAGTPVFKFDMLAELTRTWTFNNAYDDDGPIGTWVMATTRSQCETVLGQIEAELCNANNWINISLGGPPFFVFKVLFGQWSCKQLEGVRTRESQLVYLGFVNWDVGFHGEVQSVQLGG